MVCNSVFVYCTHFWQCHHIIVEESFFGRVHNLLRADRAHVVSVGDVLCNAAVKQHRLLGHNANLSPQERHADRLRRVPIYQLNTRQRQADYLCVKSKRTEVT